jgi:hypothetical protein
VHFTEADIFHTGDTFWNRDYPFIDYSTGGSIDGRLLYRLIWLGACPGLDTGRVPFLLHSQNIYFVYAWRRATKTVASKDYIDPKGYWIDPERNIRRRRGLDRGSSSNPIPKIKRKGAVSTHRLNLLAAFCAFPNQIGLAASY